MRLLLGVEKEEALIYLEKASKIAQQSLCLKRKCGAVIVANGEVIGEGYNAPPNDNLKHRRCLMETKYTIKPNFNRTCCVHAEERAICNTLIRNPTKVHGSRLYFTSIGEDGITKLSGEPICTSCSRSTLDVGISEFVLWCEDGIRLYPTDEYDDISYRNINA